MLSCKGNGQGKQLEAAHGAIRLLKDCLTGIDLQPAALHQEYSVHNILLIKEAVVCNDDTNAVGLHLCDDS